MAEAKRKPTKQGLNDFIKGLDDPQTRADCLTIAKLMEDATGSKPVMWGTSIVGFGTKKITYAGGREADWPLIGSRRGSNTSLCTSCREKVAMRICSPNWVSTK
jgi:hypothetical protein